MTSASVPASDSIQSLARGLAVIRAFDVDHPALTLAEAARRTGLSRATVRRVLMTLIEEGYAASDGREFTLRPAILELGFAYLSALGLPAIAQPHLEQLSATVGESTSMAVLDGTEIVYVARVATRRIMSVQINLGTRFPAFATSMGRVLLAALPPADLDAQLAGAELPARTPHTLTTPTALRAAIADAAAQGWAVVDQELEPGLRSIAAPVLSRSGEVVAAVNVSTTLAAERDLSGEVLPALLTCTAAIGADLRSLNGS